ncbi:MAG: DUF1801 domain-containing protein [Thaumarchaeota archaeon]|nr:DUF1801 domain-containing protein [Nitrososphaerota archaeon]
MSKSARKPPSKSKRAAGFTDEERAAMKERVRELNSGAGEGESAVLAKIAGMPQPDRALAERVHALVRASAPGLAPRLWYGMPAYSKDDNVVCFFQPAHKFKARYSTLGFNDKARLDEGRMWPTSFALTDLTSAEEARVAALVKKAVG